MHKLAFGFGSAPWGVKTVQLPPIAFGLTPQGLTVLQGSSQFSMKNVELPRLEYKPNLLDSSGWYTLKWAPSGEKMTDQSDPTHTDLQTALNDAASYRATNTVPVRLLLKKGALSSHSATVQIPASAGSDSTWIYVMPDDMTFLPVLGTKIIPGQYGDTPNLTASLMPEIRLMRSGASSSFQFDFGSQASYWRLIGLHIRPDPNDSGIDAGATLMDMGSGLTIPNQPNHLVLDRCWIHAAYNQCSPAIFCEAYSVYITGSEIEATWPSNDCQAILLYDTCGPLTVEDTTLRADGENFMTGGGDPFDSNHVPCDVTLRRVWFNKPYQWYYDEYIAGTKNYSVKNLFELKYGGRVLVEDSVFEGMWVDAQSFAMNIKSVQTYGFTEDVTIRNTLFYDVANPWTIAHNPAGSPDRGVQRVAFINVLAAKVGMQSTYAPSSTSNFLRVLCNYDEDMQDIYFDHVAVTGSSNYKILDFYTGSGNLYGGTEFQWTNSLHGAKGLASDSGTSYGVWGGTRTRCTWKQVIAVGDNDPTFDNSGFSYPSQNSDIWPNYASGDYATIAAQYQGVGVSAETLLPDGSDLGPDVAAIATATAGVRNLGDVL